MTRSRYPPFIARRFLRSRRGRSLSLVSVLTAAGFFAGVVSLVVVLAMMTGFEDDVVRRVLDFNSPLIVRAGPAGPPTIADPEAVRRRVEGVPAIEAAAAVVLGQAAIVGEGKPVQWTRVTGVDAAHFSRVSAIARNLRSGRFDSLVPAAPGARPGIVLGVALAGRLGVNVGDTIRLLVPRPRLTPWGASLREPQFQVTGLFETGFNEFDANSSFIDLPRAQSLFELPNSAHWIAARPRPGVALADAQRDVARALGNEYSVEDALHGNQAYFAAIHLQKLLILLAVGLIVLVAAVGVATTLVLTVARKRREIGVLAAVGATPRGVLQVFALHGLAMGMLGTFSGAGAAWVFCRIADAKRLIRLDPAVYYLDHLPFSVRLGDLAFVIVAAIVIAGVATIYPATRAARLDPVEALRGE